MCKPGLAKPLCHYVVAKKLFPKCFKRGVYTATNFILHASNECSLGGPRSTQAVILMLFVMCIYQHSYMYVNAHTDRQYLTQTPSLTMLPLCSTVPPHPLMLDTAWPCVTYTGYQATLRWGRGWRIRAKSWRKSKGKGKGRIRRRDEWMHRW